MYQCAICDKGFSTTKYLNQHKLRKTSCEKIDLHFECEWCDKRYKNKSSLTYHLKQKHPQNPTESHQNPTKSHQNPTKSHQNPTESHQNPTESHQNPDNNTVSPLSCIYCNKTFSRPDSLKRHINYRCKEKKEHNNVTMINSNNTINNITNNTVNNIVSFGDEDLSKMSDTGYCHFLSKGYRSVPALINYTHLNRNKPENHNVLLSDLNRNYIHVYNNNKWETRNKKETIELMFDDKHDKLVDYYNNDCPNDVKPKFNAFRNYIKDIEDEQKDIKQNILEDIHLQFYNGKDLIMK